VNVEYWDGAERVEHGPPSQEYLSGPCPTVEHGCIHLGARSQSTSAPQMDALPPDLVAAEAT
jgi:hypothetical protein